MKERRKTDRRKSDRRMSNRVGKIYRTTLDIETPVSNLGTTCEVIFKLLRMEGDYVVVETLAESVPGLVDTLGYKVHKNFKKLKEAVEVPSKELPLYLNWPYKSVAYFKALKGD